MFQKFYLLSKYAESFKISSLKIKVHEEEQYSTKIYQIPEYLKRPIVSPSVCMEFFFSKNQARLFA